MARKIDYGAGFLPQNLYQNLLNIQQQGLAERNRRDLQRARDIGGIAGMVGRMDKGRSGEAEKDFIAKRDAELARMKAGLAKIKPRLEPELYEQEQKRINEFERGSQAAMDKFKDSGFLGFGRNRDALQLPEFERKAEGFDSAGVTAAREKQKQMVGDAEAVRDKASRQFQGRGQETTDRLLDAYDLEEQGDTQFLKQAQEKAEKAQGAEGVAEGFLENRERYLQGVKGDAQQQLDDALAQQEDDRADKIYNPELGVYQSRESYKPIADYEEEFERDIRLKTAPFQTVTINGNKTTLSQEQTKEFLNRERGKILENKAYAAQIIEVEDPESGIKRKISMGDWLREEDTRNILNTFNVEVTNAEIQKIAKLKEADVINFAKNAPKIAKVQREIDVANFNAMDKAQQERKVINTLDGIAKLSGPLREQLKKDLEMKNDVSLQAFMKRLKEETPFTLQADLKRMEEVAAKKDELKLKTLQNQDLSKAENERLVSEILTTGGAKSKVALDEALKMADININAARKRLTELGPLETSNLVDRINATATPEAVAAALKVTLTGEAESRLTNEQLKKKYKSEYGADYNAETGEITKDGEVITTKELELADTVNKTMALAKTEVEAEQQMISTPEGEIPLIDFKNSQVYKDLREKGLIKAETAAKTKQLVGEQEAKLEDTKFAKNISRTFKGVELKDGKLFKDGKETSLTELETDKRRDIKKEDVLFKLTEGATSDEDIKVIQELMRDAGFSDSQVEAFAAFGGQNAGKAQRRIKREAMASDVFTPEQKFEFAKDLYQVPEDASYVDYQGNVDFVNRLIESGVEVPEDQLVGPFKGKGKQVNDLILKRRENQRKEALSREVAQIIENVSADPNVGQDQYTNFLEELQRDRPEDAQLLKDMGFSMNVVMGAGLKAELEKAKAEEDRQSKLAVENADKVYKLANAAYLGRDKGKGGTGFSRYMLSTEGQSTYRKLTEIFMEDGVDNPQLAAEGSMRQMFGRLGGTQKYKDEILNGGTEENPNEPVAKKSETESGEPKKGEGFVESAFDRAVPHRKGYSGERDWLTLTVDTLVQAAVNDYNRAKSLLSPSQDVSDYINDLWENTDWTPEFIENIGTGNPVFATATK
tara:strand:+ start:2953 stop:6297 length:3345 start_codon:yes stop_codon:yes gene_type:complete